VSIEEVVLFAAGSRQALEAADQQYSYACRDQSGKNVSEIHKPVKQAIHRPSSGGKLRKIRRNIGAAVRVPRDIFVPKSPCVACLIGNFPQFSLAFKRRKGED
jgi:hypothetical protein